MEFFAVHLKLLDTSDCNFRYDIVTEVPHLPDVTGRLTIAPRHVLLRFTPAEGTWHLDLISVFGPPVINGKVKERKNLPNVMFTGWRDAEIVDEEDLPEWLAEIARDHMALFAPKES